MWAFQLSEHPLYSAWLSQYGSYTYVNLISTCFFRLLATLGKSEDSNSGVENKGMIVGQFEHQLLWDDCHHGNRVFPLTNMTEGLEME